MSDSTKGRERAVWMVVVAVLTTSLLWLATFLAIALIGTHAGPAPQAIVVLRTLGRVLIDLALRAWPGLPLFGLGGIMLALAMRGTKSTKREVRHA